MASAVTEGNTSVSSVPSWGLTAANAYSYSRTTGMLTSGRIPAGAQHRRGSLIRPKRASSWNLRRLGRPGTADVAICS